jgi:hypothetical protein
LVCSEPHLSIQILNSLCLAFPTGWLPNTVSFLREACFPPANSFLCLVLVFFLIYFVWGVGGRLAWSTCLQPSHGLATLFFLLVNANNAAFLFFSFLFFLSDTRSMAIDRWGAGWSLTLGAAFLAFSFVLLIIPCSNETHLLLAFASMVFNGLSSPPISLTPPVASESMRGEERKKVVVVVAQVFLPQR